MVKQGFLRSRHSYRMELAGWELAEGNQATVRGQGGCLGSPNGAATGLQRALRPRPQGAKGHRSQGSSSGGLRGQLLCGAVGDPAEPAATRPQVGHLRHFRRLSDVWERIRRPGRALDGSRFPTFEASRPPGARVGCRRSSPPASSMAALFPGCAVAREGYPTRRRDVQLLGGLSPRDPKACSRMPAWPPLTQPQSCRCVTPNPIATGRTGPPWEPPCPC
ncbi:uncharacterized protein LOC123329352 [Bubalus bubalis]|uniref:uncharacterized protein LOC123329352 n=1 Tax=Bubalus bubalis TaxID=89462 RepID=UPI001E1B9483|nr:uncharacterized protein LOC123329352 [Bubalus bubalis]